MNIVLHGFIFGPLDRLEVNGAWLKRNVCIFSSQYFKYTSAFLFTIKLKLNKRTVEYPSFQHSQFTGRHRELYTLASFIV